MTSNPKVWNQNHGVLRTLLDSNETQKALELLLEQHAEVHFSDLRQGERRTLADEVLKEIPETIYRRVPEKEEHSIAWCVFHTARCEDITMNLLLAGMPQVLNEGAWLEKMKISVRHTGNDMSRAEICEMSNAISVQALEGYFLSVGRRTREIIQSLQPQQLKQKTGPERIQRIWDEEAVTRAAGWLVNYWSKRTVAGLLLMPATRHCLVHLNEVSILKKSRG